MTDDAETTRRALAFLTIAHESFKEGGDVTDIDLGLVLGNDDGEIDWQDLAMGTVVIAHLLLEAVPNIIREELGTTWTTQRLSATGLLTFVSLALSNVE